MDERILQLEEIAKELFKARSGISGQAISTQALNTLKANLGNEILKLIKKYKNDYKEMYGDETMNNQQSATELWCRVTNALINKYKPMAESDPEKVVCDLNTITDFLVTYGFLTKEELNKAL